MTSIEKSSPENPQLKYEQILKEYQEEGMKLDERFAFRIKHTRDGCFKSLDVSSPEELNDKLSAEQHGMLKFPVGFHYSIGLEGYQGEIGAFPRGEEKYVYLSKEEDEDHIEDEGEETYDVLNKIKNIARRGEKIIGFTWNTKGVEHKGKLLEYDHNGVRIDKEAKNQNLGFAMYRIHEEVFGKMEKEITPKLSLLKLYLKLGFTPKKIINPEDGKELSLGVEPAIEKYFSSGNEELPFWVYLEKDEEKK